MIRIAILAAAMLAATSPAFAQTAAPDPQEAEINKLRAENARLARERDELQKEADAMAQAGILRPNATEPAPTAATPAPAATASPDATQAPVAAVAPTPAPPSAPVAMMPPLPMMAQVTPCNPTGPWVNPAQGLNETEVFIGPTPPIQFAGRADNWVKLMFTGRNYFSVIVNSRFAETFVGLAPAGRFIARPNSGRAQLCNGLAAIHSRDQTAWFAPDHVNTTAVTIYCWQKTSSGVLEPVGKATFNVLPRGLISMGDGLCQRQ